MMLRTGVLQDREGGQAWRGDGKAVHPVLSILVVATNLTANTMEGGRSPLRKLLRDVSQNCSVRMMLPTNVMADIATVRHYLPAEVCMRQEHTSSTSCHSTR